MGFRALPFRGAIQRFWVTLEIEGHRASWTGPTSTPGFTSNSRETALQTGESRKCARTAECGDTGEWRGTAAVNKNRAFGLGTKTYGSPSWTTIELF